MLRSRLLNIIFTKFASTRARLLQYFEVRKEARTGEISSLASAKAVLSGADFALLETAHTSLRGA